MINCMLNISTHNFSLTLRAFISVTCKWDFCTESRHTPTCYLSNMKHYNSLAISSYIHHVLFCIHIRDDWLTVCSLVHHMAVVTLMTIVCDALHSTFSACNITTTEIGLSHFIIPFPAPTVIISIKPTWSYPASISSWPYMFQWPVGYFIWSTQITSNGWDKSNRVHWGLHRHPW